MGTAGRARTSKRQCAPSPLPCLIGPALPLVSRSNPSQLPPPLCWGVPLGRNRTRWAAIILCLSQKDRIDGITPPPTHTHTPTKEEGTLHQLNPLASLRSTAALPSAATAARNSFCRLVPPTHAVVRRKRDGTRCRAFRWWWLGTRHVGRCRRHKARLHSPPAASC